MLDQMRENSQSIVIYLFFTVIILAFVFQFGPQSSGFVKPEDTVAAEIDGATIQTADIDMEFTRHYGWGYSRNQDCGFIQAACGSQKGKT